MTTKEDFIDEACDHEWRLSQGIGGIYIGYVMFHDHSIRFYQGHCLKCHKIDACHFSQKDFDKLTNKGRNP